MVTSKQLFITSIVTFAISFAITRISKYVKQKPLRAKRIGAEVPNIKFQKGDKLHYYSCHVCSCEWIAVVDANSHTRTPEVLEDIDKHNCQ
jgi:hypothetical protein